MAFNISRQPLVPAFLILFMLSIVMVGAIIASDAPTTTAVNLPTKPAMGSEVAAGLHLESPESYLIQFQSAQPVWSAIIVGFLVMFTGMVLGRMAIRYNLYAVNTCITMSLFGIVACGLNVGENSLAAFAAAALMALSLKNYARTFRNGYEFDAIFRATCYQGALLILAPTTAPLLVLLPLAVLLFQRTLRELLVGVFGLLLPIMLFCYLNWGSGGSFTAPLEYLGEMVVAGALFELFGKIPIPTLLMLGTIVLLDLFAVMLFLSDLYNVGTKPRFILVFTSSLLLLTGAMLCLPMASAATFALLAIPSAILLPVLLVRIQHWIAWTIYLILLAGALWMTMIQ